LLCGGLGCKLRDTSPLPGPHISTPWSAYLGSPHFFYFPRSIAPVVILGIILAGLLLPGRMSPVDAHFAAAPGSPGTPATLVRGVAAGTPTPATPQPLSVVGCVSLGAAATTQADCAVSASPVEAFNPLGTQHTVTFTCGHSAASLNGPAGTGTSVNGCFDVTASAMDITNGSSILFTAATCGDSPVPAGNTVDCTSLDNPLCAAGFARPAGGITCSPCPTGSTFSAPLNLCQTPPLAGNHCPPGTTAFTGGGISILYCTASLLPLDATHANQVSLTINPGSPHAYLIEISGYIGTTSTGSCPTGTTQVPQVRFPPSNGAAPVTGAACKFDLRASKKYVEGTKLSIVSLSSCGGSIALDPVSLAAGTPCFFTVVALGMVILKSGVDCTDGSEPTTGLPAPGDFPPGATYDCTGDTLSVTNIPVPHIPVNLTVSNGFFSPTCVPRARIVPSRPTATPTAIGSGGFPTQTPTPVPTTTPSPTPSPSPTPFGATPTPIPTGALQPAACGPPGTASAQFVTDASGRIGFEGAMVDYSASIRPPFPQLPGSVSVIGSFSIDGIPIAGVPLYSTFHLPTGDIFCDTGKTDASGSATCVEALAPLAAGQLIPVDASFIFNCGEFTLRTGFTPLGLGTPVPTTTALSAIGRSAAPAGICVVRTGFGDLTVSASFASPINTQAALSTGPVVLGQFTSVTATRMPTSLPVTPVTPTTTPVITPSPTATNTPVPTATPTATPTVTPTPVPTATPSPTPTLTPSPTSTPTATATAKPRVLRFSLDAARVANPKNRGDKSGLDAVTRGQHVWLMLYYTVQSLPRPTTRTTEYDIIAPDARVFYRVVFKDTQTLTGQFVRFDAYRLPASVVFGVYEFKAILTIGRESRIERWRFAVVRTSTGARPLGDEIGH